MRIDSLRSRRGGYGRGVERYEAIIIGGGIAGISLGYELAQERTVGLLEMETTLAFHTTGRSAATFLETYGGPQIRALTTGSRAFFENPPDCFDGTPLSPLGLVWIGAAGDSGRVHELYDEFSVLVPDVRILDADEAVEVNPIIKPEYVESALYEPDAMEMDVHALHQGFLRGYKARGGVIHTAARVVDAVRAERDNGDTLWTLTDSGGHKYQTPLVINAAGSWVDVVAATVGARSIGISPLRRSIFMVPSPLGSRSAGMPMAADIHGSFYVKPDGEQYLCSPVDEVLQSPSDPKPDELEIARAMEAIDAATHVAPRHVRSSWAGLRNFAPDRVPVVGFDPVVPGVFWFAGQGGYGIQTCAAMARTAASLVRGDGIPADLIARGLTEEALSPATMSRFR